MTADDAKDRNKMTLAPQFIRAFTAAACTVIVLVPVSADSQINPKILFGPENVELEAVYPSSTAIANDGSLLVLGRRYFVDRTREGFVASLDYSGKIGWWTTLGANKPLSAEAKIHAHRDGTITAVFHSDESNAAIAEHGEVLFAFTLDSTGKVFNEAQIHPGAGRRVGDVEVIEASPLKLACAGTESATIDEEACFVEVFRDSEMQWSKNYILEGGAQPEAIIPTPRGYLVAGSFGFERENSGYTGFMLDVDSDGKQRWLRNYTVEHNTSVKSVRMTNDGGAVCVGQSSDEDFSHFRGFVIKVNQQGEILWQKELPTKYGATDPLVVVDSSGGIFCAAGWYDTHVLRYGIDGEKLWHFTLPVPFTVENLTLTRDGGCTVTGTHRVSEVKARRGGLLIDVGETRGPNGLFLLQLDGKGKPSQNHDVPE